MKRTAVIRTTGVGAVLLLTLGGLGACTDGSKKSSSGSLDTASSAGASGGAAAGGAQSKAAGAGTAYAAAAAAAKAPARAVVRTASLSITAKDVDVAADRVAKVAVGQGGRVDADDRSGAGTGRTASLTVRVLPANLETAMTLVDALGTENDRSLKAQDVTQTKVDNDARVKALTTSVTRLRVLMSHSATVGDLLGVETQLSTREAELRSLKAQQTSLAGQVALASLTVDLHATTPPAVKARTGVHPTGFGAALGSGLHAVAVGFALVAAGLGYALPALALVVVIAALAWLMLRRRRRAPVTSVPPAAT